MKKISKWGFQWKIIFNLESSKQAQEIIFNRKIKKNIHPALVFNKIIVSQTSSQKHLVLKLIFEEHLLNVFKKVNRTIGLLRKLQSVLPRITLVTIYKTFVRPHLDYGDMIYNQGFNNSFLNRLDFNQ